MVGLQRGLVRLEEHRGEWIGEAETAMKKIRDVLGDVLRGCEHVGSSAVEGLEAKPIIDIVVGVENLDNVTPFIEDLALVGFIRRFDGDVGDELFFSAGDFEADTRTHHVHVVLYGSPRWQDYILFRDGLRHDKVLRRDYQDLKVQLARQFPEDRQAYNEGKEEFVALLLAKFRGER